MFSQSLYRVTESVGFVRPVLVLNNISPKEFTVQVTSTDGSRSECCYIMLFNYDTVQLRYNVVLNYFERAIKHLKSKFRLVN